MKEASAAELRACLRLMVITDRLLARGRAAAEVARLAVRGGATCLQLRDKAASDAALLATADTLQALAARARAVLVVNDRPDVARLAGAWGCHLGPDDLPLPQARRLFPRPAVLGASAGTVQEARRAADQGADYLGVGPVFSTSTKRDAGPPIGPEGLAGVAAQVSLPVVAIGGIDHLKVAACIEAGACGVGVVSAVVSAASVAPAARRLRRAVDAALREAVG
ncbi:MAG: thiamine phosphate synthase [Acidobacteriota bacterium]